MSWFDRWRKPVKQVENRTYTDSITQSIIERAGGEAAGESSALEIAAGLVQRAFQSATVTGADAHLFAPDVMGRIARDLIVRGESVWERQAKGLLWIQSYDVEALVDGGFQYWIGSGSERRRLNPLHVRYSLDPLTGRGLGPLQHAPTLGRWARQLEARLGEELGASVGHLLPIPTDGDDASVQRLRKDIGQLKGRTALVESTSAGFGAGGAAAPQGDYLTRRIGARVPDSSIDAFQQSQAAVLAACGVPVELVRSNSATASREGWRRALHGCFAPLGRVLVTAADRAGLAISLDWSNLMASDISGKARAFQSMVGAGMDVEDAASLSGLIAAE